MLELAELLDHRIAVLDGAWGTMLQAGLAPADYRLEGHDRDTSATRTC